MAKTIVCFGEVLLRLATPPGRPLVDAAALDLVTGGAEANVGVALVAMGHQARLVSRLPANALGARALSTLAATGVDTRFVVQASGARQGRMGLYFLETGASLRPSAIIYDRAGSAFVLAQPEDFDFASALQGSDLLHLSGITPALGPQGVTLARAAIRAARQANIPVSFDCNFRERLWTAWDSDPRAILLELLAEATIMFGNHRDMSLLLQKPFSGDGAERRREAAEAALATFPKLQVIASTARHTVTQTHHRLAARVDRRDDHFQSAEIDITDIVDRVGSGDAFAAGVLTGWLEGADARGMAQRGLAMNALKHALHGDWLRVSRAEVDAFSGGADDVRR